MEIDKTALNHFLLQDSKNNSPVFYQKMSEFLKDLYLKIFFYVGPFDIIKAVRQVNKQWNGLASDKSLWKLFAQVYSVPIDNEIIRQKVKITYTESVCLIRRFFQSYRREYASIYFDTEKLTILNNWQLSFRDEKYLYFISSNSKMYSFDPDSKKLSKSKYFLENKNYLKAAYNQKFTVFLFLSVDKENYCIDIFHSSFENCIISFKDILHEMFIPRIYLFDNKLFILTGKELKQKEIVSINETDFKLNEKSIIETNAICFCKEKVLDQKFLILGFKDGSLQVLNKKEMVEQIKSEDPEKKFEIDKICLIFSNILLIKYKKGSVFEESSYVNIYKINPYNDGNFKTKLNFIKIYSTSNEKNRYIYKDDVLLKDKIIIFNHDKSKKTTMIGSFSLINNNYFDIADLEENQEFIKAKSIDNNLYSCSAFRESETNEVDIETEKWTFYTFNQLLDHILENLENYQRIDYLINQLTESDLDKIKSCYFNINNEEQKPITAIEFASLPAEKIKNAINTYKA